MDVLSTWAEFVCYVWVRYEKPVPTPPQGLSSHPSFHHLRVLLFGAAFFREWLRAGRASGWGWEPHRAGAAEGAGCRVGPVLTWTGAKWLLEPASSGKTGENHSGWSAARIPGHKGDEKEGIQDGKLSDLWEVCRGHWRRWQVWRNFLDWFWILVMLLKNCLRPPSGMEETSKGINLYTGWLEPLLWASMLWYPVSAYQASNQFFF